MQKIRGLIYDCDGVLFESNQANLAYYNSIFSHLGEPLVSEDDHEKAKLCHTAASSQVFEVLLEPERIKEAISFAETLDYRKFIPYMKPEPGLEETLAILSKKMPLAVATNRGTSMPGILTHFGLSDYFSTVVTSRDVKKPKPHPDMLLLVAERLGLDRSELLFVGDSVLDYKASRGAEIRFVAYKTDVEGDIQIAEHKELVSLLFEAS